MLPPCTVRSRRCSWDKEKKGKKRKKKRKKKEKKEKRKRKTVRAPPVHQQGQVCAPEIKKKKRKKRKKKRKKKEKKEKARRFVLPRAAARSRRCSWDKEKKSPLENARELRGNTCSRFVLFARFFCSSSGAIHQPYRPFRHTVRS